MINMFCRLAFCFAKSHMYLISLVLPHPVSPIIMTGIPHLGGKKYNNYITAQGRRHVFTIGGARYITRCRRQCIEAHSADQFAQKKNFAFIFQLSGWALVAPSCFMHRKFQMYEDCRSRAAVLLSCSNFAHERNTYVRTRVY